ncbi:hypothetical protein GJ496_007098 [Pomphorhynchus laevis]|nr:hypothetical protein GJ496_007098 [Pomphorhynchus laevis]
MSYKPRIPACTFTPQVCRKRACKSKVYPTNVDIHESFKLSSSLVNEPVISNSRKSKRTTNERIKCIINDESVDGEDTFRHSDDDDWSPCKRHINFDTKQTNRRTYRRNKYTDISKLCTSIFIDENKGQKRPRGRPRKQQTEEKCFPPIKNPRGRPRKSLFTKQTLSGEDDKTSFTEIISTSDVYNGKYMSFKRKPEKRALITPDDIKIDSYFETNFDPKIIQYR